MTNTKFDGYNFQHDSRVTPNLCFHFDVPKEPQSIAFSKNKTHIFLCIQKNHPKKKHLFSSFGIFLCIQKITPKKSSTIHHAPLENLILHLWKPNLHGPKHHEDHYPYYEHDPRDLKRCYVGHHLRFQPATNQLHPQPNGQRKTPILRCFWIHFLPTMCGSGLPKNDKTMILFSFKVST